MTSRTQLIRGVSMSSQAAHADNFGARATLKTTGGEVGYYRLDALSGMAAAEAAVYRTYSRRERPAHQSSRAGTGQ